MMGFQAFILFAWVLGFFSGYESLWALPAGWGAGGICFELWKFWRERGHTHKLIGVIDSRQQDLPPEAKQKMKEVIEILIQDGKLPPQASMSEARKCKDPHCSNCWGLGNNPHKDE